MKKFSIQKWVNENPEQQIFRQAVHIILTAIAGTPDLQTNMIMKGGILLALNYQSTRFTKDIDFSTETLTKDFDKDKFQKSFESALVTAVERLNYGLDCVVQRCKQNPPGEDKNFPTIQMTIGYAEKGNIAAHKRLMAKKSTQVVNVDYSLNEPIGDVEVIEVETGMTVRTYTFHDLVAEKFRALLQQEMRNRNRPQDIYDLYFVLRDHPLTDETSTKLSILESLKNRSAARNISVAKTSMRNPEIVRRSMIEYDQLKSQTENELPPFDEVYDSVRVYFEDLPWDK